jgi:DNA polymerase/3'-5' exonuclease PolX
MELEKARAIAEELVSLLSPVCTRIEIAGSIRRQKPDVGDIELLIIPNEDKLAILLEVLMQQGIFEKRPNKRGIYTYGPKNKLLVHCPSGIGVDIFSSTEENWGMALFVRTGPKEWNIKAMSRFRQLGMQGHAYGGVTLQNGLPFECPSEFIVFNLLGWPYTPPEKRSDEC